MCVCVGGGGGRSVVGRKAGGRRWLLGFVVGTVRLEQYGISYLAWGNLTWRVGELNHECSVRGVCAAAMEGKVWLGVESGQRAETEWLQCRAECRSVGKPLAQNVLNTVWAVLLLGHLNKE